MCKAICGKAGSNGESLESDTMLVEFMKHVDATQQLWPLEGRKPTALMPPTTVIRVQVRVLVSFRLMNLMFRCLI